MEVVEIKYLGSYGYVLITFLIISPVMLLLIVELPRVAAAEDSIIIITLEDRTVIKGVPFDFHGKLMDHDGEPLPGEFVELFFSPDPVVNDDGRFVITGQDPLAITLTGDNGTYRYDYTVPFYFPVGKCYGAARWSEASSGQEPDPDLEEVVTNNIIFNVMAGTGIILDSSYDDLVLERDRYFEVGGRIVETYQGENTAYPVIPEMNKDIKTSMYLRPKDVRQGKLQKISDADVNSTGYFRLSGIVLEDMEYYNSVDLIIEFEGNDRYLNSSMRADHTLWNRVFFDLAEVYSSFPHEDGSQPAVKEWEFNHRDDEYRGPLIIKVPVFEEVPGRAPPPVENARLRLTISGDYFVNETYAVTDKNGIARFEFVQPLQDRDYPDRIKLLYRHKPKYILEVQITFIGTERLRSANTAFNITYYPTEPPHLDCCPTTDYSICYSIMIIMLLVPIVVILFISRMERRKKHVQISCLSCGTIIIENQYPHWFLCKDCSEPRDMQLIIPINYASFGPQIRSLTLDVDT